jgi:glutamate 5-kinase
MLSQQRICLMSHSEQIDNLIVAKVGSSTLVDPSTGTPERAFIHDLISQIATLVDEGNHVVFVSSGAAAAGMGRLGFDERPSDLPTLQACCAAGQAALTEVYAAELAEHGVACGQVLLTRADVANRTSYLNARSTFTRLLELGAVPVVNENDAISPTEFAFGDNDTLGAIVATMLGARLYVILSDVEGLYTANPDTNPDARLIERVERITPHIASIAGGAGTKVGTGGMTTKIRAARATLAAGIPMIVCKGRQPGALLAAAHGQAIGTRFEAPAGSAHEGARKLWIGMADMPRGTITVDDGARAALVERGASLLPAGIASTEGTYAAGDVVSVIATDGSLLGRGVTRYSSEEVEKIRGLRTDVIARFIPDRADQPCIHRDELLIF